MVRIGMCRDHTSISSTSVSLDRRLPYRLFLCAKEAILLGIALTLDATSAGFGAAMIVYSPFTTAMLVALMNGLLVFFGIKLGFILSK